MRGEQVARGELGRGEASALQSAPRGPVLVPYPRLARLFEQGLRRYYEAEASRREGRST